MAIKTAVELAEKCVDVANNYKTIYVMGCFGAPMTLANKERYTRNHEYNRLTTRTVKIKSATSGTFGFDCVCLIKGLLWGWNGDAGHTSGGAKYASNHVSDLNADAMIRVCSDVSTDFSKIQVGEVVWTNGHIGVYIGNGLAVESTPIWKDGVQITAVRNIGEKSGYNSRNWIKHGKLPYVTYEKTANKKTSKGENTVTIELMTLQNGATGAQVKTLQQLLMAKGYKLPKHGDDGDFGDETDKAVRAFQKAKGLKEDGVVGKNTWNKLLKG